MSSTHTTTWLIDPRYSPFSRIPQTDLVRGDEAPQGASMGDLHAVGTTNLVADDIEPVVQRELPERGSAAIETGNTKPNGNERFLPSAWRRQGAPDQAEETVVSRQAFTRQ
jgi:hypothetical protein